MRMKNSLSRGAVLVLSIAATLVLAGWAAKTAPVKPAVAAAKSAVLEYKMPAGRVLTYKISEDMSQIMDIMGQTMDTFTKSGGTNTFSAKGRKDKNLLLGVTIDDMFITINSPMGDMSPDLSPVKGQSFDMVLSPLGSEVDVSGAEAITYASASGMTDVSIGFKLFFPDLPGKPLQVGDTWNSSSGADDKSEEMAVRMDFQYVNTFEGLETVEGMECARIKSQVTSTISGTGTQQGMELTMSGTGTGTDIWHFAVKEGIYVKSMSDLTFDMTIMVPAADMSIPVTQMRKGEITLTAKK